MLRKQLRAGQRDDRVIWRLVKDRGRDLAWETQARPWTLRVARGLDREARVGRRDVVASYLRIEERELEAGGGN